MTQKTIEEELMEADRCLGGGDNLDAMEAVIRAVTLLTREHSALVSHLKEIAPLFGGEDLRAGESNLKGVSVPALKRATDRLTTFLEKPVIDSPEWRSTLHKLVSLVEQYSGIRL